VIAGSPRDADDVAGPATPVELTTATAADTRELGRRLGALVRAGDLVVLSGDLGAGKTTLTQGLGEGLGVRGPVTSPTFVIGRVHPSLRGGPALVHVDAYRLASFAEVEDLDLEASLDDAVTVVEWGQGKVEALAADRLEIELRRGRGDDKGEARAVTVRPVGARWLDAGDALDRLREVAAPERDDTSADDDRGVDEQRDEPA
jgi:tRNA threonylcarbamoyladenosine biosynthesis protein TsaE